MKKTTLKTVIGSGRNAAMFMGAAICAITLTLAYSCSADGEYEDPWLNKEFKTRAGMMDEGNEPIYVEVLVADEYNYIHSDSIFDVQLHFSWNEGNEADRFPNPRVTIVDTTYRQPAHVDNATCTWGSINAQSINYWIYYTSVH